MKPVRWTKSALDCWRRGCVCKGCIYEKFFISTRCRMKTSVIELVKNYGPPPDEKEKTFIKEGEDDIKN